VKQGKEYETTLLGRLLSVGCLATSDGSRAEFFDRPTRLTQPEIDSTENMIYQVFMFVESAGRLIQALTSEFEVLLIT